MCGGAQIVQDSRRDDLVNVEVGTAVHDAMAERYWCAVNVFSDRDSDSGEGIALRLEYIPALDNRFSVRRPNVQGASAASNAIGASRQQRLLISCPAVIDTELQRGGAAVEDEDEIAFPGELFHDAYPGHFQLRIS